MLGFKPPGNKSKDILKQPRKVRLAYKVKTVNFMTLNKINIFGSTGFIGSTSGLIEGLLDEVTDCGVTACL